MINNEDLPQALIRGDEFAFELLFERYYDGLYRYASVMLKNREDAQEVVNETFCRVFLNAGRLREASGFSGWIFKITRNLCMDLLNKRNKQAKIIKHITPDTPHMSNKPDNSAKMKDELVNLKPDYRDILILKDIAGYEYQEISAMLNKSIPALKTMHHRALVKLRERMDS
jgi:RNA polymerase sigma-70 factor (ECF subfamily)